MKKSYRVFQRAASVLLLLLGILCYNSLGMDEDHQLAEVVTLDPAPVVALTFDDGPDPRYTPQLLDGLKARGIHATFFLIGNKLEGQEELVERMYREGHLIGNHTYSHVELAKLPDSEARQEIQKTSNAIYEITGKYPTYVRPPFGEWAEQLEFEVEMFPVMWDIDPLDWKRTDVRGIVKDVESKVDDGSVILLHDCYESSVQAALQIADDLTEQGYQFVTVDQMILE